MVTPPSLARKFSALLAGAIIGSFAGYIADQTLTHYVLQHSDEATVVIITNAVSAFVVFPLFAILGAYVGYRSQSPRKK
jgi:hypothetical protein